MSRNRSAGGPALSVALHITVVAILCLAGANDRVRDAVHAAVDRVPVIVAPYLAKGAAGGGGGAHASLPASRGNLPKFSPRQFTPPTTQISSRIPKLPMEPTVVVSAEVKLPQFDTHLLGDPLAKPGPPSDGPGAGGGIGRGCCGGVGSSRGPGAGPGEGGTDFGIRGLSGETTAPVVLFKTEPEFSEEARKAKLQGTVMLAAEVGTDGRLRNIRVTRGLGLGLDEKAVEALQHWRFRPALRNGRPVAQAALIEVNFHLL